MGSLGPLLDDAVELGWDLGQVSNVFRHLAFLSVCLGLVGEGSLPLLQRKWSCYSRRKHEEGCSQSPRQAPHISRPGSLAYHHSETLSFHGSVFLNLECRSLPQGPRLAGPHCKTYRVLGSVGGLAILHSEGALGHCPPLVQCREAQLRAT